MGEHDNAEQKRLDEAWSSVVPWLRWGPYLSERQWGTVREDYGDTGDSWSYFPHDHARSRAYQWGEDGILGICDDEQRLCFALAMWNGEDPILKERLFGLTNKEGNHGEDVKEYYYYLESTPTHSYMKGLYKYPQRAYPYDDLVATNASRSAADPEYELIDTGVFDENRYFDVFVEYAKASPNDVLIQIQVVNRGPEPASLRLLPSLWYRNEWSWNPQLPRPSLKPGPAPKDRAAIHADHAYLGRAVLYCDGDPELLFTENETNKERLFNEPNPSPFVKDGIHMHVVKGHEDATNSEQGTKAAVDYALTVPAGETRTVRLRLVHGLELEHDPFGPGFDEVFDARRAESEEFYRYVSPMGLKDEEFPLLRQALSGMLWTKQCYRYDVAQWLSGRETNRRNEGWEHLKAHDILSMPDKWEYPWFAVWDTAFHALALMLVDVEFAKHQLSLFLKERYMRHDGAIPAYEWAFDDVNPPVHAFAALTVFQYDKARRGDQGDVRWLQSVFERLRRNFDWWLHREGLEGRDLFEGGFLGLDNIGVFDRSSELPTGGYLEQSDGTAWMVFYAQTMLRMSLQLCRYDPAYEDRAVHYFDKVVDITEALDRVDEDSFDLWDEEDGFFYDRLHLPDGQTTLLKVRSLVGLLPLAAVTVFERDTLDRLPKLKEKLDSVSAREDLRNAHCPSRSGQNGRRMLSVFSERKLRRVLERMLDETEFLAPHGIRSLSKFHLENPYVFHWDGEEHRVKYLPGESDSGMFGGNSNWRGPVWVPVNFLLIRGLFQRYSYFGNAFQIEFPAGSGQLATLYDVALEIGRRIVSLFLDDAEGRCPALGPDEPFQTDPHWKDHFLFYEYFHGDDGAGVGASHQTGWTGCVATLLMTLERLDPEAFAEHETTLGARIAARQGPVEP